MAVFGSAGAPDKDSAVAVVACHIAVFGIVAVAVCHIAVAEQVFVAVVQAFDMDSAVVAYHIAVAVAVSDMDSEQDPDTEPAVADPDTRFSVVQVYPATPCSVLQDLVSSYPACNQVAVSHSIFVLRLLLTDGLCSVELLQLPFPIFVICRYESTT